MQRIAVKAVSLSISCLGFIASKRGTVSSYSIQDPDDVLTQETYNTWGLSHSGVGVMIVTVEIHIPSMKSKWSSTQQIFTHVNPWDYS